MRVHSYLQFYAWRRTARGGGGGEKASAQTLGVLRPPGTAEVLELGPWMRCSPKREMVLDSLFF